MRDTDYPYFSFPFPIQRWPIRSRPLPSGHVRLLKLLQTARTRETKHTYPGVHLGGTLVFWVFDGGRVFGFGWEARVGRVEVDVYCLRLYLPPLCTLDILRYAPTPRSG